jgi:hypothetical protein
LMPMMMPGLLGNGGGGTTGLEKNTSYFRIFG